MKKFIILILLNIAILPNTSLARVFYFIGTNSNSWIDDYGNWNTKTDGTGITAPSANSFSTDFNTAGDTFDFYGNNNLDFDYANIQSVVFINSGSAITVINNGTFYISGTPTFATTNVTYDFSTQHTYVVYNGINSGQSIISWTYRNLKLTDATKSINVGNTVTIIDTLKSSVSVLSINGTLSFGSSSSYIQLSSGLVTEFNQGGTITDNRTIKTWPGEFKQFNTSSVPSGTFETLSILASTALSGNTKVNNSLNIGTGSFLYTLSLNGKILEIGNNMTFSTVSNRGVIVSSSKIDASTGNLTFNSSVSKTHSINRIYFGNAANITTALKNIAHLTVNGLSTVDILSNINIDSSVTLSTSNFGISHVTNSSFSLNLNATNYCKLILKNTSSVTPPLGIFNSGTISNLILDFPSGSTFQIAENLTISNSLDVSNNKGILFDLNGKILTINGTISNIYGTTGGKFKGSATSSLVCGATGTLYFNQTGTDSTLKNLTINNSKTVDLGNNLKIVGGSSYGVVTVESGATLNTNGYLTLRSHAGGSAMIGNSPGTISGSIMVETFVPATARRYRFLSSPVTGATAVHWRNNGTYTKYKGIQITGGGANWSAQGFDESQTNNPSAFYYNEAAAGDDTTVSPGASNDAGWTAFSSGSEALVNGKGFRVLVRGDRGIDLKGTGGSTSPIATTLKVTGSYVGTSATINVTNSGRTKLNNGINFVGNPYPCTIDWDALTLTNVDPSYLIYDPSGNRYRAWNGTTGGAGRYISSGQAFLVYCTSTSGGSITVNESDKVTNTTGGSFFQTKLTNHLKIELAYDTLNLDETYIHFREDATDRLDRFDVRQVKNSGVNIASIDSANLAYNINSLGNLTGSRRIPLSVEGTAISNGFKLTFNDVATFPFHKIYLIDNFKGTKTLLQEAATFVVDITADKASYQNGRFYLDFQELPQTNIKKINSDMGLVLFPNPANDIINLEFGNTLKNKNFQFNISSIHGESVLAGNLTAAEQNKINIKNLASGIYFINISNSEKSQSIQFIKK